MKHALLLAALALPAAAHAQEAEEEERGLGLMERGAQLFFEGLMDEMEPAIEGFEGLARDIGPAMRDMLEQMGPAFAELMDSIDDLSNYEPPAMLPNGDIIIRRKPDAPEFEMPDIGEDGAVEL
ncbi:MAG: hypothetical protein AAFP13_07050 [Pseudomonadota bacterium]